jgi:hypothetical protein
MSAPIQFIVLKRGKEGKPGVVLLQKSKTKFEKFGHTERAPIRRPDQIPMVSRTPEPEKLAEDRRNTFCAPAGDCRELIRVMRVNQIFFALVSKEARHAWSIFPCESSSPPVPRLPSGSNSVWRGVYGVIPGPKGFSRDDRQLSSRYPQLDSRQRRSREDAKRRFLDANTFAKTKPILRNIGGD